MSATLTRHRPTDPIPETLCCPTCGHRKSRPEMGFCNPCWMHLPIPLRSALLKNKKPGAAKHVSRPGLETIHAANLKACFDYLKENPRKTHS